MKGDRYKHSSYSIHVCSVMAFMCFSVPLCVCILQHSTLRCTTAHHSIRVLSGTCLYVSVSCNTAHCDALQHTLFFSIRGGSWHALFSIRLFSYGEACIPSIRVYHEPLYTYHPSREEFSGRELFLCLLTPFSLYTQHPSQLAYAAPFPV